LVLVGVLLAGTVLVLPPKDHFPERGLFPGLQPVVNELSQPWPSGWIEMITGMHTMYDFAGEIEPKFRSDVDDFNRSVTPQLRSRGWTRKMLDRDGGSVWSNGTRQLVFSASFPDGVDVNDPRSKRQIFMIHLYDSASTLGERLREGVHRTKH
jgi:hypothetical protein